MYAVFRTGGKQFRVEPGSNHRVPTLEAEEGPTVSFAHVLITSDGAAGAGGRAGGVPGPATGTSKTFKNNGKTAIPWFQ